MNAKSLRLFLFFCLLGSIAKSQPAFFEKVFGDSADNCSARSLVQLASGKLVVATNNFNISGNTIKLFGFDSIGNYIDTVSFLFATREQNVNRMVFADGFFYLTGYEYNGASSNSYAFILKADTNGNCIWNKFYGDSISNYSFQGITVKDHSVFCSGYVTNPSGNGNSMYVMKLDTSGNFSWDFTYHYLYNTVSDAIMVFPDGYLIASGDKSVGGLYTNFLVKLDTSGNFIWDFDLPNPYNNGCKNDFLSASGDIYIVGESATQSSFYFDAAVTRMDTAGNVHWSYIYQGSPLATDAAMAMIEPVPDNFLITGYGVNPANNSADIFLMRIDSAGSEINRTYIGDNTFDISYAMIKAAGNAGCYIAGATDRNGHNQNYLIYTGLAGIESVPDNIGTENNFIISPNPCIDRITIKNNYSATQNMSVSLSDITGKNIMNIKPSSHQTEIQISVNHLAAGIYFICINNGIKMYNQKIIIQK